MTRAWRLTLLLAAACAPTSRLVTITSQPSGAFVQIDGQNAGNTPFAQNIDLTRKKTVLTATKAGFFMMERMVSPSSPEIERGEVNLVLMEDEAWRMTTTCEATNAWLRIQVDNQLASESVWQKIVDSVTSSYASLEQLDNASGYMRSVATMRKFKGPKGEFRVRTRFIGAIAQKDPLVYKLKIESEVADGEDWEPYARVFKGDAALIEELQSRLGVK